MSEEQELDGPFLCKSCGADLGQRGGVTVWIELPERSVAHLEPGEGNGVNLVFDGIEYNLQPSMQCSDCGEDVIEIIEDMFLDPECEIEEREEF